MHDGIVAAGLIENYAGGVTQRSPALPATRATLGRTASLQTYPGRVAQELRPPIQSGSLPNEARVANQGVIPASVQPLQGWCQCRPESPGVARYAGNTGLRCVTPPAYSFPAEFQLPEPDDFPVKRATSKLRRGGRGGGRTWRSDKRFAILAGLAPILERLSLTDESWMNLVRDFRRKFRRAAGTPASMKKEALANGQRKLAG